NEPGPLSLALVTRNGVSREKLEVLLLGSVAVALTGSPRGKLAGVRNINETAPVPSVVTFWKPRKVCPLPKPLKSRMELAKNSMRKVVFAVLCRDPLIIVPPPLAGKAEYKVGKAWLLLTP